MREQIILMSRALWRWLSSQQSLCKKMQSRDQHWDQKISGAMFMVMATWARTETKAPCSKLEIKCTEVEDLPWGLPGISWHKHGKNMGKAPIA